MKHANAQSLYENKAEGQGEKKEQSKKETVKQEGVKREQEEKQSSGRNNRKGQSASGEQQLYCLKTGDTAFYENYEPFQA